MHGVLCLPCKAQYVSAHDHVRVCVYVCRYHLFGETGTYAMLMEGSGIPDKLHMSDQCAKRIMARQEARRRRLEVRTCVCDCVGIVFVCLLRV